MIDYFCDATGVNEYAQPLDVDDCLIHMLNFMKKRLYCFIRTGLSDEEFIRQLQPLAEIASQLPVRLRYVSPELALPLSVMCLYDLVVLVGRCISHCHCH